MNLCTLVSLRLEKLTCTESCLKAINCRAFFLFHNNIKFNIILNLVV